MPDSSWLLRAAAGWSFGGQGQGAVLEDDPQGREILARVAAWDIGKVELVCCVRVPQEDKPTTRPAHAAADDPYRAVHHVYRAIANGSVTGCAVFSPRAAQQFAAHFGAPDCAAAITRLTTEVTSVITYASTGRQSPDVYLDDTITISSCTIRPEGGPPLGQFALQRMGDTWYILRTRHGGMFSAHNGAQPSCLT